MFEKFLERLSDKVCQKLSENDNFADIVSAAVVKRLSTSLELISEEVLKLDDRLTEPIRLVIENGGYLETTLARAEDAAATANEVKAELEHIDFTKELKGAIAKIDRLTTVVKQKKNGKKKGK